MLILMALLCSGQVQQPTASAPHYIEIKLPDGVRSESFFVRYALAGEDFGDWVHPRPGVSSYFISTAHKGRPATRIKAILYAPGCAIQTLDVPVSPSNNQVYSFVCRPLASVWIAGALTRMDLLNGHEVKLQASYVARWAQPFLGVDNSFVTGIPVGDVAYLSADGHFRLTVPDFSEDALAAAADHPGELQIWARDKITNIIVAQLIPAGSHVVKARMGGLKIRSEYPSEIVFTPCPENVHRVRDAFGFALRTDLSGTCER
jgi:hypothetical protein